jgi:hypothetical protein
MERKIGALRIRRRYLIHELPIPLGTVYVPFEIKLPATIKNVTGIAYTNTADNITGKVSKLGTLGLISNDEADLFVCIDIYDDVLAPTDEEVAALLPLVPESNKPWITGKGPGFIKVLINGNTGIIVGWYKTPGIDAAYTIKIYVQYEELDELIELKEAA